MNEKTCIVCPFSYKCTDYGQNPGTCNIYKLEQERKELLEKIKVAKNPDNFNNFSTLITANCKNCKSSGLKDSRHFNCKNIFTRRVKISVYTDHVCRRYKPSKQYMNRIINRTKHHGDFHELLSTSIFSQLERLNSNLHKKGFENINLHSASMKIENNLKKLNDSLLSVSKLSDIIKHLADIANYAAMGIYTCKNNLKGDKENDIK